MVRRRQLVRRLCYVTLAALFVVMTTELIFASTEGRSAKERAEAWARENAESLPATLPEIAAFPREYRDAIRKFLPADVRSRLWRAQLQAFLGTETSLSRAQREYVLDLMAKLTKENIEKASEGDQDVFDICETTPGLFPDRDQRMVFALLGWRAVPARSASSILVSVRERIGNDLSFLTPAYAEGENVLECTCRGQGWCECTGNENCGAITCETGLHCGCGEDPSNCTGICVHEALPLPFPR